MREVRASHHLSHTHHTCLGFCVAVAGECLQLSPLSQDVSVLLTLLMGKRFHLLSALGSYCPP